MDATRTAGIPNGRGWGGRGARLSWRRSRGNATAAGQDLNATDLGVIRDGGKLDDDLPTGGGCGRELLHDRLIRSSRRSDNVEVGQNLLPIDRDIENALAGAAPEELGLVQAHRVGSARAQIGEGVGKVAIAFGLINRLGSGIGDTSGRDSVRGRVGTASAKEFIGGKGAGRRSSRVHRVSGTVPNG